MMMGIPLSSANCLDGLGSLPAAALRPGGGAPTMRVPSPAAGMMTTTFMRARVYQFPVAGSQLPVPSTEYRVPSTEYRVPSTEYRVPSTEYRVPSTEYRVPSTE